MTTGFEHLTIRNQHALSDISGAQVFHVTDSHALTQAAGYLKYVCGEQENIFFRGQSKLYPNLRPSLFRASAGANPPKNAVFELRKVIKDVAARARIFGKFNSAFHEPLLQHYGLKTTWVDLVDNVWVALWFACYDAFGGSHTTRYLHFERRNPNKEVPPAYIYILMIGVEREQTRTPGLFSARKTELVDLRIGCPSVFVRPHAQHGVLFRMRGDFDSRPSDYSKCIRGVIRADLREALAWLGDGTSLNTHTLMPPPFYDDGYRILLNLDLPANPLVGTIQHIGA